MVHKNENPEEGANGIALPSESSRTPEFKRTRNSLVRGVDQWLAGLAEKRDAKEPLPDGTVIGSDSRIIQTTLGKTAAGHNMMAEERKEGVTLTGNGKETRLKLQAVVNDPDHGWVKIECQGPDPLAEHLEGGEYTDQRLNESVVTFTMTGLDGDGAGSYFGCEVTGSGAVDKTFMKGGWNVRQEVRDSEGVALAAAGFEQIKGILTKKE